MSRSTADRPALAGLVTGILITAGALLPGGTAQASTPTAPDSQQSAHIDVATGDGHIAARAPATKRKQTALSRTDSREYVHVKFVEGSGVRLRDGRLVSTSGTDLTGAERALAATTASRLFNVDEQVLERHTRLSTTRSGRQQADLNLWYRLRLKPGTDPVRVIDALNRLAVVETAYPQPLPAPSPVTPNLSSQQGYRSPAAASGIDMAYAHTIPGGRGANVQVLDIEYAWNTQHEDVSKLRAPGAVITNGTPVDPYNDKEHGTAVAGILSGDDNGLGVTGLVPDAALRTVNANNAERGYELATAITLAATRSSAGDVILLEQQFVGPAACADIPPSNVPPFIPVEQYGAYYDAIVAAVGAGIVVVESSGNGYLSLDDPCMGGTTFPGGRADSGAIIVAAGGSPGCATTTEARARLDFATYGQRVNLQGWGNCVATTGYGDLYGTTANDKYTGGFSGGSSASPIVAAAAASLSSIAEQRNITLTPNDIRTRLINTGTPQANSAFGHIGPLPNLRAAILGLPAGNPRTASASVSAAGLPPANAIDGNPATRWSTGVAQANGQYFQLDLGTSRPVNQLVLDAGSANPTHYPRGWQLRTSTNGTTWSNPVATGTGTGRLTTITFPTTTTRYLRVTQTGSATVPWGIAEASTGTVAGDFAISTNPTAATVQSGASATATVTTSTTSGTAQPVQLTATGAPSGVTVSFNPATVTSGATSTMTVAVGAGVVPGTYSITIIGTSSVTRTAAYSLTVTSGGGTCGGIAAWQASAAYTPGQVVTYNGRNWTAAWYSSGAVPSDPASWSVWTDSGAC